MNSTTTFRSIARLVVRAIIVGLLVRLGFYSVAASVAFILLAAPVRK